MKLGDKVAIVCCSNGQKTEYKDKIEQLKSTLLQIGLVPVSSNFIYARENSISGTAEERAKALMDFYADSEIKAIFDISGGDLANEILPYLDFDLIAQSEKRFWGYSDLTTIINAIYTKTGNPSVLYQIRNLIYEDRKQQIENFENTVMSKEEGNCFNRMTVCEEKPLYDIEYSFIQGTQMQGIVVGGNIRCMLKLAGTQYWPDMNGKILLLESFSGLIPQMVTYLSQLKQMGVFDKVNGILLGTFTQMEKERCVPHMKDLIGNYVRSDIPIVYTREIGHGKNSKGIVIGQEMIFKKNCKCRNE